MSSMAHKPPTYGKCLSMKGNPSHKRLQTCVEQSRSVMNHAKDYYDSFAQEFTVPVSSGRESVSSRENEEGHSRNARGINHLQNKRSSMRDVFDHGKTEEKQYSARSYTNQRASIDNYDDGATSYRSSTQSTPKSHYFSDPILQRDRQVESKKDPRPEYRDYYDRITEKENQPDKMHVKATDPVLSRKVDQKLTSFNQDEPERRRPKRQGLEMNLHQCSSLRENTNTVRSNRPTTAQSSRNPITDGESPTFKPSKRRMTPCQSQRKRPCEENDGSRKVINRASSASRFQKSSHVFTAGYQEHDGFGYRKGRENIPKNVEARNLLSYKYAPDFKEQKMTSKLNQREVSLREVCTKRDRAVDLNDDYRERRNLTSYYQERQLGGSFLG
mmetsp:Transcript_39244/g.44682  ORF Transcript_39244/g.44682 Transcript_39244/m.44682 type:complete len:386 (-) Transcript_39244:139-1296(-)